VRVGGAAAADDWAVLPGESAFRHALRLVPRLPSAAHVPCTTDCSGVNTSGNVGNTDSDLDAEDLRAPVSATPLRLWFDGDLVPESMALPFVRPTADTLCATLEAHRAMRNLGFAELDLKNYAAASAWTEAADAVLRDIGELNNVECDEGRAVCDKIRKRIESLRQKQSTPMVHD
jgi:hypothetical protein